MDACRSKSEYGLSTKTQKQFLGLPARVVLYILSLTGFIVSYMMRTDINIAIVAMAKTVRKNVVNSSSGMSDCYINKVSDDESQSNEDGEFDWGPFTQTTIISSFYWCYVPAQVVGGILSQRYGPKLTFGYGQLLTAVSALCIPAAADLHYSMVIALRCIQGVSLGVTWPAMCAMIPNWIPPSERSRFMSSFQGVSIGIGIMYPLAGLIISYYGWRPVFYTTGTIGCIWCIAWWLLVFDYPRNHPRISKLELAYIIENTKSVVDTESKAAYTIPWLSILKSLPAWSIGITTFGRIWLIFTLTNLGPLYMKNVLGFSIKNNGILNGIPAILSYIASFFYCLAADNVINKKTLTATAVRKIFTGISQVIPGVLVIIIAFSGCNTWVIITLWYITIVAKSAAFAGAMANMIDIAPNFAGAVAAFTQTIHMNASFIAPMVAGIILEGDMSIVQWRTVFLIAASVSITSFIVYLIFGSSEVQPWNYPKDESTKQNIPLKSKNDVSIK